MSLKYEKDNLMIEYINSNRLIWSIQVSHEFAFGIVDGC